jgi:hypothetical protein
MMLHLVAYPAPTHGADAVKKWPERLLWRGTRFSYRRCLSVKKTPNISERKAAVTNWIGTAFTIGAMLFVH